MTEPGWPFGNRPPARLLWKIFKAGGIMSCEINEHPLGWEIRCYLRGNFHHSEVLPSQQLAEDAAQAEKATLIDLGWTDHPGCPRSLN